MQTLTVRPETLRELDRSEALRKVVLLVGMLLVLLGMTPPHVNRAGSAAAPTALVARR